MTNQAAIPSSRTAEGFKAPIVPMLTPMQEKFARLYAHGLPGSWAYRQAGYAPNATSEQIATNSYRLRNRPHIAARILELKAAMRASSATAAAPRQEAAPAGSSPITAHAPS